MKGRLISCYCFNVSLFQLWWNPSLFKLCVKLCRCETLCVWAWTLFHFIKLRFHSNKPAPVCVHVCVLPVVWWPFAVPGIFLLRPPNKGHRKSHWSRKPSLAALPPGPLDLETHKYTLLYTQAHLDRFKHTLILMQTQQYNIPSSFFLPCKNNTRLWLHTSAHYVGKCSVTAQGRDLNSTCGLILLYLIGSNSSGSQFSWAEDENLPKMKVLKREETVWWAYLAK